MHSLFKLASSSCTSTLTEASPASNAASGRHLKLPRLLQLGIYSSQLPRLPRLFQAICGVFQADQSFLLFRFPRLLVVLLQGKLSVGEAGWVRWKKAGLAGSKGSVLLGRGEVWLAQGRVGGSEPWWDELQGLGDGVPVARVVGVVCGGLENGMWNTSVGRWCGLVWAAAGGVGC